MVSPQMINVIEINKICDELGTAPPKVVEYANCSAIIIRNGDGLKVLIVADEGMSRESVKHRIAAAFKIKAENLPSADKVAEVLAVGETKAIPAVLIRKSTEDEVAMAMIAAGKLDVYEASSNETENFNATLQGAKKPEPVTPAKEIRAHQEAKKPHNK